MDKIFLAKNFIVGLKRGGFGGSRWVYENRDSLRMMTLDVSFEGFILGNSLATKIKR